MSVVDMLNKKHKVMNCVFEILYDLYGEPVWLNKPKDGQEPEKIIEQWIKELGDYSETQLKQACYNLFKYKKVATFPKLAHILAELSDQDKEEIKSKTPETPKAFMCLEVELMKQDIKRNKCKEVTENKQTKGKLNAVKAAKNVRSGLSDIDRIKRLHDKYKR